MPVRTIVSEREGMRLIATRPFSPKMIAQYNKLTECKNNNRVRTPPLSQAFTTSTAISRSFPNAVEINFSFVVFTVRDKSCAQLKWKQVSTSSDIMTTWSDC